jgi:hypothetical protein
VFGTTVTGFIALYGLIANLIVATAVTAVLQFAGISGGTDRTRAGDYA